MVEVDRNSHPAAPTMADTGILASLDPVALDQASVDLVRAAPDGGDLSNVWNPATEYIHWNMPKRLVSVAANMSWCISIETRC